MHNPDLLSGVTRHGGESGSPPHLPSSHTCVVHLDSDLPATQLDVPPDSVDSAVHASTRFAHNSDLLSGVTRRESRIDALLLLGVAGAVHWLRALPYQCQRLYVPVDWEYALPIPALWPAHIYVAEPPRARPFFSVRAAPIPRSDRRFPLCRWHSAFTPVGEHAPLDPMGLLKLTGINKGHPLRALAVGMALYGLPIFASVPATPLRHNNYNASGTSTSSIPASDARVVKIRAKELVLGAHTVVTEQSSDPECVIRLHPVNFVLKPTYVDGRTVPPQQSALRMVDDLTFQASDDPSNISVNNASDPRHLPPIHLAMVQNIMQHLKYVHTASVSGHPLDAALCHSSGDDDRLGFKLDVSRAYRNCAVLAAHGWMTAHEFPNADGDPEVLIDSFYPFGMKQSTKVWTIIGTLLNCSMQAQHIAVFDYSDDFMGVTTPAHGTSDVATVTATIESVGLQVNADKLASEGFLHPIKTFLGVRIDVRRLSASLCPLRCAKLTTTVNDMLQHRNLSATAVKSLAHKFLFVSAAVPYATAMTIDLFAYASSALSQRERLSVTPALADALKWWKKHLPRFRDLNYSFHPDDEPWYPSDVVFTDASGHGFGGVSTRYLTVFQGMWSALERSCSITHREAFAVLLAVLRFAASPAGGGSAVAASITATLPPAPRLNVNASVFSPAPSSFPSSLLFTTPSLPPHASPCSPATQRVLVSPPCLVVMCDNLGAVNLFDKGFSSDPVFGYILRITAQVLHQCQFHLRVFHVSGVFNNMADLVSRQALATSPAGTPKLQLSTLQPRFRWLLETALSTASYHLSTTHPDRNALEQRRSTGASSLSSAVCQQAPFHGLSISRTISSYRTSPSSSPITESPTAIPSSRAPSAVTFPPFVRDYLSRLACLSSATQSSGFSLSDSVRLPLLDGIVSLLPSS